MKKIFITHSKEETQRLGAIFASHLQRGDVVLMRGELGAGKTTFTGGMAKALDIEDDVVSPSFNIMRCYFDGKIPLYHIDAYRLEGQNIEIGLDEYIEGDGICVIEWPDYIAPLLPKETISITINYRDDGRELTFEADTPRLSSIIEEVEKEAK